MRQASGDASVLSEIFEWHEHDLVTGWLGLVPRPLQGNKGAAAEFRRKLFAIVEYQNHRQGMRFEQKIGLD
jgi:hypothetical protein